MNATSLMRSPNESEEWVLRSLTLSLLKRGLECCDLNGETCVFYTKKLISYLILPVELPNITILIYLRSPPFSGCGYLQILIFLINSQGMVLFWNNAKADCIVLFPLGDSFSITRLLQNQSVPNKYTMQSETVIRREFAGVIEDSSIILHMK